MAAPAKEVFVDEDVGKDEEKADGSKEKPFKTLFHAYVRHPPKEGHQYFTRKSETGPIDENGDPTARLEWKPAAKSGLKKAATLYEQHLKKQAKMDQLALRERQEAEARALVLQEARKRTIELDDSLPRPMNMYLDEKDPKIVKLRKGPEGLEDPDKRGTRVRVRGRIHR